ncbi:MAG: hypothetical protein IE937_10735 [Gammaproteobacteria bacterium]|nr:hypothetical protein [Gammaproteobacteria bacterium]
MKPVDELICYIQGLGCDFTPEIVVEFLRKEAEDGSAMHPLADLIEALRDRVQELEAALDQSKGN